MVDESMENELRDSKNILTNLSNHENQNQVILLKFYFLCNAVNYLKLVEMEHCIIKILFKNNILQLCESINNCNYKIVCK